jgi:acetate kinase
METNNGTYLIINPGSTSTCYILFKNNHEIAYAYFLNRFTTHEATYRSTQGEKKQIISEHDYNQSSLLFLNYLRQLSLINAHSDITHIGLRVVAPGTFFTEHRLIDETYMTQLKTAAHLDPLHIDPLIKQIETFKKLLPDAHFHGLSDSAFHSTMSPCAKTYALPQEIMQNLDIHRFGYHGLACASIMRTLSKQNQMLPEKIIVCHLGGGTSITAIKDGKSMDTSMGYSPLEGLPMATRAGNVDANALMQIMQAQSFNPEQLRNFLYTQCGLLGLGGKTGDMRQIEAALKEGNSQSKYAVDFYVYAITKAIGAYAIILGGLDMLVLTGGISVHLPFIRTLICNNLGMLQINLDEEKSEKLIAQDGFIEARNSKVKIAVLEPNEELEMYEIIKGLIR